MQYVHRPTEPCVCACFVMSCKLRPYQKYLIIHLHVTGGDDNEHNNTSSLHKLNIWVWVKIKDIRVKSFLVLPVELLFFDTEGNDIS
jgi:hypothetical protein